MIWYSESIVILWKTVDCEHAIHDALLIAEGICQGGAYHGYEYDFNEAYLKLYVTYEHNKMEV